MPPRPTLPHSSRPSARNGPGPGAFCVPHSCRPQPPALFYWSVRALFLAPSAGSLLPPRGPLLKPAMSTVQAAGRSGDGGGGGEGPLSFLRTPALLSPPGPPFSKPGLCGFCFSLRLQEKRAVGLADRIMTKSADRGPPAPCRALSKHVLGGGPQRAPPDPRLCPFLSA